MFQELVQLLRENDFGDILKVVRQKFLLKSEDYVDALAVAYILLKKSNVGEADVLLNELKNAELPEEWRTLTGGSMVFFDDKEKSVKSFVGFAVANDLGKKQEKKLRGKISELLESWTREINNDDEMKKFARSVALLSLVGVEFDEINDILVDDLKDMGEKSLVYALTGDVEYKNIDDYVGWIGLLKESL
jgi:hypothetical protein